MALGLILQIVTTYVTSHLKAKTWVLGCWRKKSIAVTLAVIYKET
jgi:hypothetical protein